MLPMIKMNLFGPGIETTVFRSRCVNAAGNTKMYGVQFAFEACTLAPMSVDVAITAQNRTFHIGIYLRGFVTSLDTNPMSTDQIKTDLD